MELTPNVIIALVVVVVVGFALILRARRHEAAAPEDAPRVPVRSSTMPAREDRESQPLVKWLLDRAHEQTGFSVAEDPLARDRITQAAAKAMEELRTGGSATISLPFLTADASGPKHFSVQLKRTGSSFEVQA